MQLLLCGMTRNSSDEHSPNSSDGEYPDKPEWIMPEAMKTSLTPENPVKELLAIYERAGSPLLSEVRQRYFRRLYPLRDQTLHKLQSLTQEEIASLITDALSPLLEKLSPQLTQRFVERAVDLWRLPTLFESHFTFEFTKWVHDVEQQKRVVESERQRLMSVDWVSLLHRFGLLRWSGDSSRPYVWLGSNLSMLYDVWQALTIRGTMVLDFNTFSGSFLAPDGTDFPAERAQRIRKRATDKDRSRRHLSPEIESALRDV